MLDEVQIQPFTDQIYSVDVVYRRLDAGDELMHRGWKMILLSPHTNP